MESTDGAEVASLSDSFITGGQYVVEPGPDGDGMDDTGEGPEGIEMSEPLREQDRFLPIANVARIMKKSVPKNGKIAKDAKECAQECVSEFISFVTSEASERCHQEKRKTINGEDILFAMSTLGFDNYVEPLKLYLQKYRETLHQTTSKIIEKSLDASSLDELTGGDEVFTSLSGNILDPSQSGVIYTTYQPQQITHQQLNFG